MKSFHIQYLLTLVAFSPSLSSLRLRAIIAVNGYLPFQIRFNCHRKTGPCRHFSYTARRPAHPCLRAGRHPGHGQGRYPCPVRTKLALRYYSFAISQSNMQTGGIIGKTGNSNKLFKWSYQCWSGCRFWIIYRLKFQPTD